MHLYKVKAIVSQHKHTAIFSKAIFISMYLSKAIFLSMYLFLWMNVMQDFICKSREIGG